MYKDFLGITLLENVFPYKDFNNSSIKIICRIKYFGSFKKFKRDRGVNFYQLGCGYLKNKKMHLKEKNIDVTFTFFNLNYFISFP